MLPNCSWSSVSYFLNIIMYSSCLYTRTCTYTIYRHIAFSIWFIIYTIFVFACSTYSTFMLIVTIILMTKNCRNLPATVLRSQTRVPMPPRCAPRPSASATITFSMEKRYMHLWTRFQTIWYWVRTQAQIYTHTTTSRHVLYVFRSKILLFAHNA